MPLSELVILLQDVSTFVPQVLAITPWPAPSYPPQSLLLFPAVAGGPPPQTNWFNSLTVTPYPATQYQPAVRPNAPLPSPSGFVPNLLADTITQPWPAVQYPPAALPEIEPVSGPFFPEPLSVTPWPAPQYQSVGLPEIEPVTGPFFPLLLPITPWTAPQYPALGLLQTPLASTPGPAAVTGFKIQLRGVKRRPSE